MTDSDPEYLSDIEIEHPGLIGRKIKDVPGSMYSGQKVTPFGISKPTEEQRHSLWSVYHDLRGETPDGDIEREPFCSKLEGRWAQLLQVLGIPSISESLPSLSDLTPDQQRWLDHNSAIGDINFPSNLRILGNPQQYVVKDVPLLRKNVKPVITTTGGKGVGERTCLAFIPMIEEGTGGIIFATDVEKRKTMYGSHMTDIPLSQNLEVLSHGRIYWPPYEITQMRDMLCLFYLATLSNTTVSPDRRQVLLQKIEMDYKQVSASIKVQK